MRPTRVLIWTIFSLLLLTLLVGLGPNASTRAVALGESLWPGYASELRAEPTEPTCDQQALTAQQATCVNRPPVAAPEPADPFAEPEPADPFADEAQNAPVANCAAVATLAKRCAVRWARYTDATARRTPAVLLFQRAEGAISSVAKFPFTKHLLVLLVLLGGLTTTVSRVHIALREPTTRLEHTVSQGAQLLAHLLWMASCGADWQVQRQSAAEIEHGSIPVLWTAGFGVLALANLWSLARPPALSSARSSALRVAMVVPLFAYMSVIAGLYFLIAEAHPSGQAIFLHKFIQIPSIYLGIGLYIWSGMLLARTRIAPRVFDVLLPWKLPPTLLAWLVVVLSALPTAYSGASGIFVIAAGAVIFERLTSAGAPPRIAVAATAMSGSLGVVLRPCLVVVLVAVLNKDVTTDALFFWGRGVFGLTAGLFLLAMLWRNDQPLRAPPLAEASRATVAALMSLLPYGALMVAGLFGYWFLLGTAVTEHTAAYILPGLMLALTVYDRLSAKESVWSALSEATEASAHHVGALLFVMAGSVGIGGLVERADLMSLLPEQFGSRWLAMLFLVVVMVIVGMTMDALGAVILVSVSLAHVADANGIHPVHFWMMVLCAFELGYLTPPVALNHLLARQVIGPAADVADLPADSWAERYEHILLPMGVMSAALLIVAFVPLWFIP